ncbi:unnamed protein product [Ectocarpus sp. CCAP 1310/34]|nr:unnamed protein product [Ectocarpus sp. CCAP 1310/34]
MHHTAQCSDYTHLQVKSLVTDSALNSAGPAPLRAVPA